MQASGSQTEGRWVWRMTEWISWMNLAFYLASSVKRPTVLVVPRSKVRSNEEIIMRGKTFMEI
jgi:hypothetical protein